MRQRIYNTDSLFRNLDELTHIAVKRCGYYHHYVAIAQESVKHKYLKIVHYNGGLGKFLTGSSTGQIEKTNHSIQDVRKEIRDGLYILKEPNYPNSLAEFAKATGRWICRLGERAYHVAFNNCEHFATYVMTGRAKCKQIENGGMGKKFIADSVDTVVNDGKSNASTAVVSGISRCNNVHRFMNSSRSAIRSGLPKVLKIDQVKEVIYPVIPKVASTVWPAVKNAVTNTARTVAKFPICSMFVDSIFAFRNVCKLNDLKDEHKIGKTDFKREVAKNILMVPLAGIGTAIGGVFGGPVGAIVGNVVGKIAGSLLGRFIGRFLF